MRILKKESWPHRVIVSEDDFSKLIEIETWLGETIGMFKNRWNVVYNYNKTDFYFRCDKDSLMFVLRWT